MRIRSMVIEGKVADVTIVATDFGATVKANDVAIDFRRDADHETQWAMACNVARVVCGETRDGGPNATRSMINDLFIELERIASL